MEAGLTAYQQTAARDERERLILDHLEDVRHLHGRIAVRLPAEVDRQNLESAGVLGLVEAANQYDRDRGVEFGAFARLRIRGAILDELRRNCPLPQRILKRMALLKQAKLRLDPPVTDSALAQSTGLSAEEIAECRQAALMMRQAPWTHEVEQQLADHDEGARDGAAALAEQENRTALANAIEKLRERERLVLTLYHLEDLRLREIAEVLKVSESRVSRLLSRAESQLREMVASRTNLEFDC